MKFAKFFYGCKAGDIYPTQFQVGDECPDELVGIAKKLGVLEAGKKSASNSTEKEAKTEGDVEPSTGSPEAKEA